MTSGDPFGWVGATIDGKYRVDEVVAEGGFAVVFRGFHLGLDQKIAIKCLKVPSDLDGSERDSAFSQFLAEGKLLHKLSRSTADIVQALDVGIATSPRGAATPYLVLEWLDGQTLEQMQRERRTAGLGGWSLSEAMAILEPATRALVVAHEQGVVHRDVKPANLFLAEVGGRTTLKVLDFGIAKILAGERASGRLDDASTHAPDTTDTFTPRYGAPEHFKRTYGRTSPATDVYGLALCLVEMVTGKTALEGKDASEIYLATSSLSRRPTIRALGGHTSDAVEAVLLRALAVDPQRRYATVREMWDALAEAAPDHAPVSRPTSVRPSVRPALAARPSTTPPPPDARLSRTSEQVEEPAPIAEAPASRRDGDAGGATGWLIALAVLVAGGLAIGSRVWGSRPPPPEPAVAAPKPVESAAPDAGAPERPLGLAGRPTDRMVRVPATTFVMGSDSDGKLERPAHRVTLTRAFYIDMTEVPAAAYALCEEKGACTKRRIHSGDTVETAFGGCNDAKERPRHPANCVDHDQAAAYCAFAGKRLPTEAEWELAARGSDERPYPWGDAGPTTCWMAIVPGVTGACAEHRGTWEVGVTAEGASAFGALDMAGNVWEWVDDGFDAYPTSDVTDPRSPILPGGRGVLRGGSWDYSPQSAKTTYRLPYLRRSGHVSVGMRCARDANDDGG
ncbi:MAG: SUMF1/EgtB/PvdO family nonheme iron enzyme [Polyangiaceae bacterium]